MVEVNSKQYIKVVFPYEIWNLPVKNFSLILFSIHLKKKLLFLKIKSLNLDNYDLIFAHVYISVTKQKCHIIVKFLQTW